MAPGSSDSGTASGLRSSNHGRASSPCCAARYERLLGGRLRSECNRLTAESYAPNHLSSAGHGRLRAGFAATPGLARNVDLSTVPKRDTVQLTIYNSEDLTLVRETRTVTFKKGVNPLQFSWAHTLIDPTSVEIKFLSDADKLEVLDTTYPHDKPQMLFWNVESQIDGEAKVQITYFTSGITWSADYLLIADKDEKRLNFEGFVRVFNHSGEEYEDAQVRLVVGTINLVEKIAQLAHVSMSEKREVKQIERRRNVASIATRP